MVLLNTETLAQILFKLFPKGTQIPDEGSEAAETDAKLGYISSAPVMPTDIFGATAHLLEKSGAYHRIFPIDRLQGDFANDYDYDYDYDYENELIEFAELGRKWNCLSIKAANSGDEETIEKFNEANEKVKQQWTKLLDHSSATLHVKDSKIQEWWFIAATLLIFSDEACRGLGYKTVDSDMGIVDTFFKHDKTSDEKT